MRILLILHYPLDPDAGAAGYTLRLAEGLRQTGNDVKVVGASELLDRNVRRPAELAFPLSATARAVTALRSQNFDVVDASTGDLWPCPPRLLQTAAGIAVTRSHGLEHIESRELLAAAKRGEVQVRRRYALYYGGIHLRQVARSLRVVDGAIFCNQADREFAVNHLGVDESRAFFVRAGLADHFRGLPAPRSSAGQQPRVAVIGPYMWRKGARAASAALTQILQEYPQARASWLGAPLEAVLGDIDPDVRERVTVVPHYRNAELPVLLRDHHILLVLSRSEGFPGVILEGMGCGLAIIASDIPGPRDILADTGAGLLVPPGDSATVAKEYGLLFEDRARLDSMRQKGHELAQTYQWQEVAAENLEIYRSLLERKRSVTKRATRGQEN